MTEEQAAQQLEQLPDDSDFKIEYAFEEVEVAVGEKAEELVEEELIDDSGALVGRFSVPVGRFWMVAVGMLVSTLTLTMLLLILLKTSNAYDEKDMGPNKLDENLDMPQNKLIALPSFVADVVYAASETAGSALRK